MKARDEIQLNSDLCGFLSGSSEIPSTGGDLWPESESVSTEAGLGLWPESESVSTEAGLGLWPESESVSTEAGLESWPELDDEFDSEFAKLIAPQEEKAKAEAKKENSAEKLVDNNKKENEDKKNEISRAKFLKMCAICIKKTAKKIASPNQVSSYYLYRNEIKHNNLFKRQRTYMEIHGKSYKNSYELLQFEHGVVKTVGLGNCYEKAVYLCVELMKMLKEKNVYADLEMVKSQTHDHIYLRVNIQLLNEKMSLWEVDAWHPRVIDITPGKKRLKNEEELIYGKTPRPLEKFNSKQLIDFRLGKISLPKAKPGTRAYECEPVTPEHDLSDKMYADNTIDEAEKNCELPIISNENDDSDVEFDSDLHDSRHWQLGSGH